MFRNARDEKNSRFVERPPRLTILAKLANLAIFCQFCPSTLSVAIYDTPDAEDLAFSAKLTKSAILAMF